ncbi:hypothetical protein UXP06_11790 [Enterobacter ludwigii]|uniref:hypothetical protein n=1 Tax=Enterobacter ludwigii TaxID=299767 RepID=UPI002FCF2281
MTVSTVVDHNDYIGNGVTTSFPYTFRIFKKADLTVSVIDLSENITVLALDTDYTVTNAGGYNGGSVVLTAPLTNGWQISIARELEPTQETDLRNQGKFFAEVHEDAFDKLTMLIQQAYSAYRLALRKPSSIANWYDALNNYIRNVKDPRDAQDAATKNYVDTLANSNFNRSLRVPEPIGQLPNAANRANKIVAFDASGNPIVIVAPSGSASDVLIQLAKQDGESLIGGATYAQIRASNVAGNQIKCLGRSANRDGGEGWFFLDASDTTTADDDGTVLVDSVGRRWKRSYDGAKMAAWWGVKDGADISTPLHNALNTGGGKIEFKDGQYTVTTGAVIDFSTATIPPVGRKSQRFSLVGESQHDTTFNTNNNTFLTYTGDTQGDGQGLFSSMRIADFCVYGTNNTGVAMRLKSAVGLNVQDVQIRRHNYALFLSGVLTSSFDNIYLDYNNYGLYLESATNSQINNVSFTNSRFNSLNQQAVIGQIGIRASFIGCSFESCGWNTNDSGGTDNTGTVYLSAVVPFSTISFGDCYFEACEGLADITINNTTASPIIVNISNTDFTRGNIRGKGSKNVLNFLSTGGGPILLNLRGCSFITNTGTGFVANPAWVDKSFLKVSGLDTCMFSDPATLPANFMAQGQPLPLCVSSTGAMTSGPTWLTVTKTSTGVYAITSIYTLGVDNDSFVVMASPRVTGFRVDVTKNSRINLTVRVRDSTGTLADGAFDLAILTGRGEGR